MIVLIRRKSQTGWLKSFPCCWIDENIPGVLVWGQGCGLGHLFASSKVGDLVKNMGCSPSLPWGTWSSPPTSEWASKLYGFHNLARVHFTKEATGFRMVYPWLKLHGFVVGLALEFRPSEFKPVRPPISLYICISGYAFLFTWHVYVLHPYTFWAYTPCMYIQCTNNVTHHSYLNCSSFISWSREQLLVSLNDCVFHPAL